MSPPRWRRLRIWFVQIGELCYWSFWRPVQEGNPLLNVEISVPILKISLLVSLKACKFGYNHQTEFGPSILYNETLSSQIVNVINLATYMELTFSSGPCTWPVTVPLLVFFTQPTTPIFLASPSVYWFRRDERKEVHRQKSEFIIYFILIFKKY